MSVTNKRLLISESHDNSNRCTPCRGKLDQHDTYASYERSPYVATFHEPSIELSRTTAPEKMGSRHNPQYVGWPICGSVPNFAPKPINKAVGAKSNIYRRWATRLTGPISLACDRYVQYLLTGANSSVLNRHKRGLPPRRWRFATYHYPTFPTSCLHFPLRAPSDLQFS
jgi:hypothetical protein